jgi:ribonuclease HI
MNEKKNINFYTDGACSHLSTFFGAFAIIGYIDEKEVISYSEYFGKTTSNRMELSAVIWVFKNINFNLYNSVNIFTDSKYVSEGMNNWIFNWVKKGWRTAGGKDVLNIDLWMEMEKLMKDKKFKISWVPGHSDNIYNNKVDNLARSTLKKFTDKVK